MNGAKMSGFQAPPPIPRDDGLPRGLLKTITSGSNEVLALIGAQGELLFLSGPVEELIGVPCDHIQCWPPPDRLHPDDRDRSSRVPGPRTVSGNRQDRTICRIRHAEGHYVPFESTVTNRLHDPLLRAVIVHSREIKDLRDSVHRDRRVFVKHTSQALDRLKNDKGYGFCVIRFEIDQIETLMGTHGRQASEQVSLEIAIRLRQWLRPDDHLAQLGTGEFWLLIHDVPDTTTACRMADRLLKSLDEGLELDGQKLLLSATIGIATSERSYSDAEELLRDATAASNRARHGSSRRELFETKMRLEDTEQIVFIADLKESLKNQELQLYYQPIISLSDSKVVGFEALIRWINPYRGVVSPAQFIPVAEETGLIIPIGRWVLMEGARQIERWNCSRPIDDQLYLSVNVSPMQILDENLLPMVTTAVCSVGIDPRLLKFEITESAVLDNIETAIFVLNELKKRNHTIILDDFGTGYSSFSYLHQLPYDTLKIDRSFIQKLGESSKQSSIVETMITLGNSLDMETVAEGVETELQARLLRTMGCKFAQGFYYSEPLPVSELKRFL